MTGRQILVINLGASSSKFALFEDELCRAEQGYPLAEEARLLPSAEQLPLRLKQLQGFLREHGADPAQLDAIAARGGLTKPLPDYGVYAADEELYQDLAAESYGSHPANLSAPLARRLLADCGSAAPVFVVDPVSIDMLWPRARLSGLPGITRQGRHHALNVHRAMREAARRLGRPLHSLELVVGHFGSGVSICSVSAGRVVDVNNALLGEGPFSVARAGSLPLEVVLELCFSGTGREELTRRLSLKSGLAGYTGSADLQEIEKRCDAGDTVARAAYEAMVFQSAKYLAAAAGALGCRPDALVLTGALLRSARFAAELRRLCGWLAPVIELPGEEEMQALAEGVLAVVRGQTAAMDYSAVPSLADAPPRTMEELVERAAHLPPASFIVAGAEQAGVAESALQALERGLGRFILLGDAGRIAAQLPAELPPGIEVRGSAEPVAEALELAAQLPGAVLVKGGCDSARLLRGVLAALPDGNRPFLSHAALIENPFSTRLLALSDGGLNVAPDCARKVLIMENSLRLLRALGITRPGVLLAAGMEDKGQDAPAVADARTILARWRAGEWPAAQIDGPYGLDVALSVDAARAKGISSPLSGRADLVLCPDLESCNFAVKMAHMYGGRPWAGVILGGRYPVVLGSRADEAASRLASLALAKFAAGPV